MADASERLTERQRQYLEAIVRGTTSMGDLAKEFGVSPDTVKNTFYGNKGEPGVFQILDVDNKTSAVLKFVELKAKRMNTDSPIGRRGQN